MGFGAQNVSHLIKELGIGDMSVVQASIVKQEEVTETDADGNEVTKTQNVEYPYHGEEINDEKLSWGLNYNEFIAPMVLMIQNQQKRIEEQEKRIDKLEKLVEQLLSV
jgi:hypothetical protein